MKAKDITVGTEYAVGRHDWPRRAVVLEIGPIKRQITVPAGRGFARRESDAPAARVRRLDEATGEDFGWGTEVVPLGQVLHTWEDELEFRKARKANDERLQRQAEQNRENARRLARVLQDRVGIKPFVSAPYRTSITITLTPDQAAKLMEVLER